MFRSRVIWHYCWWLNHGWWWLRDITDDYRNYMEACLTLTNMKHSPTSRRNMTAALNSVSRRTSELAHLTPYVPHNVAHTENVSATMLNTRHIPNQSEILENVRTIILNTWHKPNQSEILENVRTIILNTWHIPNQSEILRTSEQSY